MCSSLANFFPPEYNNQFATEYLKVGAVIKKHSKIAKKEKRMIIVGKDDKNIYFAFILINSEICQKHLDNPKLRVDHLELEKTEDRKYIDHISFVDCSKIHTAPIKDIQSYIAANPDAYLDCVNDTDIKQIKAKIRNSVNIKPQLKKDYGLFH